MSTPIQIKNNDAAVMAAVLVDLNTNLLKLNGLNTRAEGVLRARRSLAESVHWLGLVVRPVTTSYPEGNYPAGA